MRRRTPRTLSATVTYLAMESPPHLPAPPSPLIKSAILRAENPSVHFYRYLYDVIGRRYYWIERRLWSDARLQAHLDHEKVVLYVLYLAGVPGGMVELDYREPGLCQICYFGLTPEFTGRRIGPWFLHQIVETAWIEPVKRITLNTCTLDHKKALAIYQRAGFVPYARSDRVVTVPDDFPEI